MHGVLFQRSCVFSLMFGALFATVPFLRYLTQQSSSFSVMPAWFGCVCPDVPFTASKYLAIAVQAWCGCVLADSVC